jgi:four helix bundle protein
LLKAVGKRGNAEFQRFLQIESGSASELDYHLLLAYDLNLITGEHYHRIAGDLVHLRKTLNSMLQKVEAERLTTKC